MACREIFPAFTDKNHDRRVKKFDLDLIIMRLLGLFTNEMLVIQYPELNHVQTVFLPRNNVLVLIQLFPTLAILVKEEALNLYKDNLICISF